MPSATVQLQHDVKKRLDEMKLHPRESYSAVIARLIDAAIDDEPLSPEDIRAIEISLEEIRRGEVYTLEEVKEEIRTGVKPAERSRAAKIPRRKKPAQTSPPAG
jgi:predicted transcriptional regulator